MDRRRQAALSRHGGTFHQYGFSRRELLEIVPRHGFTPMAARPYDPARVLRGAARALRGRPRRAAAGASSPPADRRRGWLGVLARRGLYSEPALRLLGHMLLVVARRA